MGKGNYVWEESEAYRIRCIKEIHKNLNIEPDDPESLDLHLVLLEISRRVKR